VRDDIPASNDDNDEAVRRKAALGEGTHNDCNDGKCFIMAIVEISIDDRSMLVNDGSILLVLLLLLLSDAGLHIQITTTVGSIRAQVGYLSS
jgi:hypothetical protein